MQGQDDFGTALRTLRQRFSPGEVGVPASLPAVRRVPGLRRDELAGVVGVSEEHVKRLEQGRRRPSPGVVDAIARALRLAPGEHDRLRALAGFAAPPEPDGMVPREITEPAHRMLARLTEVAVCVCDASWTVLAANELWHSDVCTVPETPGRGRNVVWRAFTEAGPSVFQVPDRLAGFRATVVAELREAARRYPADAELSSMITDLRRLSGDFVQLWDAPPAPGGHADRIRVPSRVHGHLDLDLDVMTLNPGDLRVVVYSSTYAPVSAAAG
ncbi:helix-turn-helix domain-containing protein [Catenuloplanes atrovinosus]|uniref:Transcriptional regulator with XRE-family HTH domain n=1 Tax=Catenuloplanes atrovinosus TaxID=137266 RepID=A0AAE3YNK2_9ACTN|nr:helix-turn-helix transcriptional regulator [Catenuloplanes atrovinosus]MDR7277099.1 transcriptional regulator with XRE-family HTH domain [Catenuloplanes atrovinosus]